jgi:hypothetical protein
MAPHRTVAALIGATLVMALIAPAQANQPAERRSWTLGGIECGLIPIQEEAAAPPFGALVPCPGVRPGAVVRSDAGQCSFNFLWTDPSGTRYMGTAGHCILDGGEQAWAFGSGPVARNAGGQRVGEFVYAILEDPKDFALIRLDPGVAASAQMCHFGGPTGQNDDLTGGPVVLHHFGQGLGLGATVPGRSAVAKSMPNADHVFADGAAIFGDSGSGAISADGRAVGVLVTIGVHVGGVTDNGVVGLTRLKPQVSRAEQVLQVDLTLQTAGLL